jgi:hypothetical protein
MAHHTSVCFWRNPPSRLPLESDRKVPDPVNWTMQRAQKHELQKSLSSMVLEQRCVADITEQHFDLFLP